MTSCRYIGKLKLNLYLFFCAAERTEAIADEETTTMKWIDINERLPTKPGWYKTKSMYGEVPVPFIRNGLGILVWLLPDISIITHWLEE